MFKKLSILGALLLSATLANAATITPSGSGSLVLTVLSLDADSSVLGFDVRGTQLGDVSGSLPFLGNVYVTDGVPLGFPSPAFPNGVMVLINSTLLENGLLVFDTPALGGSGLLQTAGFSPLTSITDPAMAEFVNFPPLVFDWAFTRSTPNEGLPGSTLSYWEFVRADSASAIPEPASLALVGFGACCLGLIRRTRGTKSAS